ncbi:cytochrome c3 family protein [Hoeflea olei]|uniref:Cytochrome c7-like domain-containing protein n=1 Tax=Hoeflea olei TaxID=1480615 RepID=A0A1C1YS34_9HYPH|nr:cytochrome c3 family protein [Hoeflea olei]OCW56236.1 hypothetical protein AWJ14_19265 [Hoeflea olei]
MHFPARILVTFAAVAGIAAWSGMVRLPFTQALAQDQAPVAPVFEVPTPSTLVPAVPNLDAWRSSAHADITREAFRHWDHEDDKMIPEMCSKCHSTAGFMDYLGADGSAAGTVDTKHSPDPATAMGISCMACHNDVARSMTSVTFPSGVQQEVLTADARCMTCHGGRASTVQVKQAITEAGTPAEDTPSPDLAFVNIHYRPSAAGRFGGEVHGGFEYDGKDYAGYYFHDQASRLCTDCHSPHKLVVKVSTCSECHREVVAGDKASLRMIRTSKIDFDGNGNVQEGIHFEVEALRTRLLDAIKGYGKAVTGTEIAYHPNAYPYFFQDTDGNGTIDEAEAKYPNRYQSWTPRHLKAAYNYQFVTVQVGAYTHNPRYALQLLYDSIADLAEGGSGVEVIGTRPD